MASFQPTILPARKQPLEHFFGGLNKGLGNVSDVYTRAMVKDKFGAKKAAKELDLNDIIPDVIAGTKSPSILPGYAEMAQGVEATNPGMADMLDAGEEVTDAQGGAFSNDSYGDTVRDALTSEYAPGYTRDQVKRKVMGLPVNVPGDKSGGKLPGNFSEDFRTAYSSAGGDEEKFVANLKALSIEYGDNPAALSQISKLISLNKPAKSSKSSTGLSILDDEE